MTLEIVAGQTLDLSFETRGEISASDYLDMIRGKTAAIVRYAARAGALVAGATPDRAAQWGEFGLALGLGFQIRDDLLGVWGSPQETGKAPADDVRRRKQTLPILLLRGRVTSGEQEELARLFASSEIDPAGVERVLQLLDREAIRSQVEAAVAQYHDEARTVLKDLNVPRDSPYAQSLFALVDRLSVRSG
jgi:geranylgeranyl diphosphate synthase type I